MNNPAISYTFLQDPSLLLFQLIISHLFHRPAATCVKSGETYIPAAKRSFPVFFQTKYSAAKITYLAILAAPLKPNIILSFTTERLRYRLSSTQYSD